MNESSLRTIEQIREFLAGTADAEFSVPNDETVAHAFVQRILERFRYFKLPKGQRGILYRYMQRLTGYSRQHLDRLIAQYRQTKSLAPQARAHRTSFARTYTSEAVLFQADLDSLHDTLSGPATRVLAKRAYECFSDARYERLAKISVSHLYNLRASTPYQNQRMAWRETRPSPVAIGMRRAPAPNGIPGYIRIDMGHSSAFDAWSRLMGGLALQSIATSRVWSFHLV